jgi:hypothetical protein
VKAERRVLSPDQKWAARIIRRMLLDEHPAQLDATIDPAKQISIRVGRGGAKTTTKRVRAVIKLLWLRNQRVGFAATSADHARELNWDPLKRVCEAYGIRFGGRDPDVSFLDTKMIMTCHRTGSIYRLRGVEDKRDAEKFRGFPLAEFQVDECGSFPPELLLYLLEECVQPRQGEALALPPGLLPWLLELEDEDDFDVPPELLAEHRGGITLLGSTPPSMLRGEFYEVTREGSTRHRPYELRDREDYKGWLGYSSHTWTLLDVVSLPRARERFPALVALWEAALRKKEEKGWSDDHPIWMREYLGKWSANNTATVFRFRPHDADGKPWNEWDPFGNAPLEGAAALKVAIAALPKDVGTWHHVVEMDMGSRDPFACNVFSFAPADPQRQIIHTFAFERTGMYPKLIAEILIGPEAVDRCLRGLPAEPYAGLFGLTGWPDAVTIDADQATIDELAKVYGVRAKKAEKKADYKYGAIELVNGDLVDGRIKILKDSPLAKQIAVLQWKPDEFGNPREDKAQANHSTDTLIYGRRDIATLFESGVVVADGKMTVSPTEPASGWTAFAEREPDLESLLAEPDFDDGDGGGWL